MKNLFFDQKSCCICGLISCNQSFDHQRVSLTQLKEILMEHREDNPEIDNLKFSVKNKFYRLKKQLIELVLKQEKSVMRWIDSFYFDHLKDQLKSKNIKLISDILGNDFNQLPNKDIKKIIKCLQTQQSMKTDLSQGFLSQIKQDIEQVLNKIEIQKIIQELDKSLKFCQLGSFSKYRNKPSKLSDSVKTCHSSSSSTRIKHSQPEVLTEKSFYEWKHIKITHTLKTLQLNNRNITDHDIIKQIPIISTFSNIRQLEVRNNKITPLTCSIIANQMDFLTMIDLRGNKLGDQGLRKIICSLNRLKALYISETGVTDQTGQLIVRNLPDLETLWAEYNLMTGESCVGISQKPKMRLLSLLGNPLSQEDKERMRKIFVFKGYLNL